MSAKLFEIAFLRQYFSYNPETGVITRIKPISVKDRNKPGSIVGGSPDNGYYRTKIFGKRVHVHVLAYALHHGLWPNGIVDHKDRNSLNNRIDNLREAIGSQNHYNTKQAFSNQTGYRGVVLKKDTYRDRPYCASIRTPHGRKSLGHFATAEEASLVYEKEAKLLHKEFYLAPNYVFPF